MAISTSPLDAYMYKNKVGNLYFLNTKLVTLKGTYKKQVYYFTRKRLETGCQIPPGFVVVEGQNNMPLLKKK